MSATKKLVYTAICIAIGILLPMLFHLLPIANAGSVLCPMHIPVLLCGFLCGWAYGGVCGIITPLLSSLLTGMPPLMPYGVSMMFELCAYGLLAGLLYQLTKKKLFYSLIGAMLGGRIVMGIVNAVLLGLSGTEYGLTAFLTAAFVTALPGILLQLVLVPAILFALRKAKLAE